jgi:hypothetical protein
MPFSEKYRPETLHDRLGPDFFDPVEAADFPAHILRYRNQRQAEGLGLGALTDERHQLLLGNEAQLTLVPGVLDLAWGLLWGHAWNPDNATAHGRRFLASGV